MKIDIFSHFCTKEFRKEYFSIPLRGEGRRSGPMSERTFIMGQWNTDIDVLWDFEQRIKVLDQHGVDVQVLTLAVPMVSGLEERQEMRLARLANDSLADLVEKHRGRFIGVATLPLSSPGEALDELDRCVEDFGFKGFQMPTNINGISLDSNEIFPLFERAARKGLPVWVHPTTPVTLDILGFKGDVDLFFGWPLDTSIALLKLATSGIIEKLPNLKMIIHHLGAGMVPYFMERFERIGYHEYGLAKPVTEYWRMLYYDTVGVTLDAFTCGYNVFGPDHVVFGVDYPYGPEKGQYFLRSRQKILDDFISDAEAKKKIYEGNAKKLLNL